MIELVKWTIRTVLVADEPEVLQTLQQALAGHPAAAIVGEARSLALAVELLEEADPDLVFIDLELDGPAGTDVLDTLRTVRSPDLVLSSSSERDAVRAFNAGAVDFLLKPFDADRVVEALRRADVRARARAGARHGVEALVREITRPAGPTDPARRGAPARILIRDKDQMLLVGVDQIDWIEAEGNYVRIHAADRQHLKRSTLTELEHRLRPHGFARIHRSTLVKVSRIDELEPWVGGDYLARLEDGRELKVSRTYRDELLERFI